MSHRSAAGQAKTDRDFVYEKKRLVLLDFANTRIRKESTDCFFNSQAGRFFPYTQVHTFDGTRSKVYLPLKENTDDFERDAFNSELWFVESDQKGGVYFDANDLPVFLAHGLVASSLSEQIVGATSTPKSLRFPINEGAFLVHGSSILDGRRCLVLRTRPPRNEEGIFDELWVDRERESAILRVVTFVQGKVYQKTDIEYQPTRHGWFPGKWVRTHSTQPIPGTPGWVELTSMFKVKELILDGPLTDSDFDVPLRPGMAVVKNKMNYRVASDGQTLEPVTQGAGGNWMPAIVITIAALLGISLFIVWKRRGVKPA